MPNNFKYHIRKLDLLRKQRRPVSTKHTDLLNISSPFPSAPEALIKPDDLATRPCPALSRLYDHVTEVPDVYLMCLFFYCHRMKLHQSFFSQYQIPLFYEAKS